MAGGWKKCDQFNIPWLGTADAIAAMPGKIGIVAPNGGNTPDIDDDVMAAIALAAVAALKLKQKLRFSTQGMPNQQH